MAHDTDRTLNTTTLDDYWPSLVIAILGRIPLGSQSWETATAAFGDARSYGEYRPRPGYKYELEICQRADVLMAWERLPHPHKVIVWKRYVEHESITHLSEILRVERETVALSAKEGIECMSFQLGWRDGKHWKE